MKEKYEDCRWRCVKRIVPLAVALGSRAVFLGVIATQSASAGPEGKAAFDNHCRTCHSLRPGDQRLGPSLYGIFGADSGRVRVASDSAQGATNFSIAWDEPTLDRFIANPDQVIPNNGMRPYSGITDAAVRRSIIEFLRSSSGS